MNKLPAEDVFLGDDERYWKLDMHVELKQVHGHFPCALLLSFCLLLRPQFGDLDDAFGIGDTLQLIVGTLFGQVHAQVFPVWIHETYAVRAAERRVELCLESQQCRFANALWIHNFAKFVLGLIEKRVQEIRLREEKVVFERT